MKPFAIVVFILVSCTVWDSASAEKGFLMTCPRSLTKNAENILQFNLFDVSTPGDLTIRLLKNTNDTVVTTMTVHIEEGTSSLLIPFFVPKLDDFEAKFQVEGKFGSDQDPYKFVGEDKVNFKDAISKIIFIQTDKPLYKIEQTVQFRVLPLDTRLRLLPEDTVGDIWVQDPGGFRWAQWKAVPLGKGIVQLDFPLTNEPSLGIWTIQAQVEDTTQSTTFEVSEYVLPKFEVIIKPPSFVLADAEIVPIQICAQYTYGKLAEGQMKLKISLEQYYWRSRDDKDPVIEQEAQLEGCYTYNFNITGLDSKFQYTYRRIKVFAEVTEKGTGVVLNATTYFSRTQTPLNLNFQSEGQENFKAGLPYKGSVKVTNPDDTPAADEPVEICSIVTRERVVCNWFATRKIKTCQNFTSNEKGIITFTVLPQTADSVEMLIEAKSLKYPGTNRGSSKPTLYNPSASLYLRPWYSPSGSLLQIQSADQKLSCGSERKVQVLFTAHEDGEYKFFYEVLNRGQILKRSYQDVSFKIENSVSYHSADAIDGKRFQLLPLKKERDTGSNSDNDGELEYLYEEMGCDAVQEADYVPYIGSADIEIDVTMDHSPDFYVLVYYIRSDSETVADSRKIPVQKCFQNKVSLEFSDEVRQPGTKTTLSLGASPNSLCGIKAIDKSVTLLNNNDQLTKKKIFEALVRMNDGQYYPRNHCNENRTQPGLVSKMAGSVILPPLPPNPGYTSSPFDDSTTAFESVGLLVISDLMLMTRPCKNSDGAYVEPRYAMDSAGGPGGPGGPARYAMVGAAAGMSAESHSASTKSVVDVRTLFPETWLFGLHQLTNDGSLVAKVTLPHTITEWIANAVCVNQEDGLGLSENAKIKAFQEFFLSLTLPYSVIRGEIVPIIVTIFNYIDECLPISLELEESPDFTLISESRSTEICVCGGKSETYVYKTQMTSLGTVNITVRGQSADESTVCGDQPVSSALAKDAVKNPLLVEPEGFSVNEVSNYLFCPKDSEGGIFKKDIQFVPLNDNVVPDSAHGYVIFTGDVMGPSIQGIDRLVQMPTGCGEQNLVLFAPNVYVLDYLTASKQLTADMRSKAIRNLQSGYQKELKYQHSDGSYSAFGGSDKEGSMFLSAFVLKSFAEASKYIDIDPSNLNKTSQWIISNQNDTGCFNEVGKTLSSSIKGGIKSTNTTGSLTAYVLVALLKFGLTDKKVIDNALICLYNEEEISPFQLALFAYAFALAGDENTAAIYLDDLFSMSNDSVGVTYFPSREKQAEIELETAAYTSLTLLQLGLSIDKSLPVIRYITSKRNSNGGFISTQDTVLALAALSRFAELISTDPVELQIEASNDLRQTISINEDDKIIVKKYPVSSVPGTVSVEASGTGCGLIQGILLYNTVIPLKKQYFSLQVKASSGANGDCKLSTIEICTRYIPEGKKSSMALVQIKMLSGMAPLKQSLEALKNQPELGVMKTEFENNELTVYLDEVTNKRLCFEFVVEESVKIEDRKPAPVKVFDYYNKENEEQTMYSIEGC